MEFGRQGRSLNMLKLQDIINEIQSDSEYKNLSLNDKNIYESYAFIGELLTPQNAYSYKESPKGLFVFTDDLGFDYFVRMVFQPTSDPYFEIKMGWLDLPAQLRYKKQSEREIDERRSDTVAKIYKDEIMPSFINQTHNNKIIIKPNDIKRYQFSIRLVNKFTPKSLKIIENKPYEIIITKEK